MSLTLHFHPLSSFCHKALIALYENGTPFTPKVVDLMNEGERNAFRALWPIGKFPVLRDEALDETVPESSVVIEYLDQHYPGATRFIPADADAGREVRLFDRFFDLYIHLPMQRIVGDRLRPADKKDPHGVAEARAQITAALDVIERGVPDELRLGQPWATGDIFTLADCAAAPALFYADKVLPFGASHPRTAAYLARLKLRPSYARVLQEAEPYFKLFPQA